MSTPGKTAIIRALDAALLVATGHDPDALLREVLDAAIALVGAERGLIVAQVADLSWEVVVARNFGRTGVSSQDATFSRTLVALALDAGAPISAPAPTLVSSLAGSKSWKGSSLKSALAAPLGGRRAALVVHEKSRPQPFSDDECRLIAPLASLAGHVLDLLARNVALEREVAALRASPPRRFPRLVGSSSAMEKLRRHLERVCTSEAPVLIVGETGTGKEEVARTLHEEGPRRQAPFVAVNVTALPESLLEAQLFGYGRGAFTGAETAHDGFFRQAQGGTLFLDEIGDLPLAVQPKLLRVLQGREVVPLGASKPVPVDVRIVAATHRDLEAGVQRGAFREDLFYRLNVLRVETPSLRDRAGDLPELADHFVKLMAKAERRRAPRFSPAALEALERHPWPGNVRELENVTRRAIVLGNDPIEPGDLGLAKPVRKGSLGRLRKGFDREVVVRALDQARGSVSRAGVILGVSRASMYRLINDLHLRKKTESHA